MQPTTHHTIGPARLEICERFVQRYLRYILIRCTIYTNRKSEVERIAANALVTTCLLLDEMAYLDRFGQLIDAMVDVIGADGDAEPHDTTSGLVLDEPLSALARAVNALDGPYREALLLHHVEGLNVPSVAHALQTDLGYTNAMLIEGESQVAGLLQGFATCWRTPEPNVPALLRELAQRLTQPWTREIAQFALTCLATCPTRPPVIPHTLN